MAWLVMSLSTGLQYSDSLHLIACCYRCDFSFQALACEAPFNFALFVLIYSPSSLLQSTKWGGGVDGRCVDEYMGKLDDG